MSVLRKLKNEDAKQMLMWMHDDDITKWFNKDFSTTAIKDCIEFIDVANKNCEKNLHLAIVDEQDKYCGTVSLKNIDNNNHSAEFAIVLSKNVQGTGLARLAYEEIINIGKNDLHLLFVYFSCLKNNIRANKFYKKMNVECVSFKDLLKKYNVIFKSYENFDNEKLSWYIVNW